MPQDLQPILSRFVLSGSPRHYRTLRDSMWLYLALVLLVEEDGAVHKSLPEIGKLTGIKEATLRSWAGHLRKAGFIRLKCAPGARDLVIYVHGSRNTKPEPPGPGQRDASANHSPAIVALAAFVRRGLGDETEPLESYLALCEQVPREVVKTAFEQARRVPQEQIRKSRAALFRYLIQTYANKQKTRA